jgi:hypothetical protein
MLGHLVSDHYSNVFAQKEAGTCPGRSVQTIDAENVGAMTYPQRGGELLLALKFVVP